MFLSVIGVVCIALSGLLWYFQYNRSSALDALTDADLGIKDNNNLSDKVINIALFGIDARNLHASRANSDSIMILSIDSAHKKSR